MSLLAGRQITEKENKEITGEDINLKDLLSREIATVLKREFDIIAKKFKEYDEIIATIIDLVDPTITWKNESDSDSEDEEDEDEGKIKEKSKRKPKEEPKEDQEAKKED